MEDKKLPIYQFRFTWNQEDYKNNGILIKKMYKTEQSSEELLSDLEKFKQNIEKSQLEKEKPIEEWVECIFKYIEHESWCIQWFEHYTLNKFENDEEINRSFDEFVERKKKLNRINGHREEDEISENKNPFYCLMGAEDSWRWKICKCEHCKEQGKIIIGH